MVEVKNGEFVSYGYDEIDGEGYGVKEDLGAHGEHHPELSQRIRTVAKIAGIGITAFGVAYGVKKSLDRLKGPSHNQD